MIMCKSEMMKKYLEQAKKRVDDLQAKLVQIHREENEQADPLAKATSVKHVASPTRYSPLFNLHH